MQEKYSAKDYVDAVASEIDEAAKASLEANRTLVETLQNLEGDLRGVKGEEERRYLLTEGFMYISPAMVSLELAANNIERLLNIINITASLKGLEPKEASVMDKDGYALFNYYIPFVDDEYILLDYYENMVKSHTEPDEMVSVLTEQFANLKSISEKVLRDYGSIVVRRKGREK